MLLLQCRECKGPVPSELLPRIFLRDICLPGERDVSSGGRHLTVLNIGDWGGATHEGESVVGKV